jgi:hypothetical protein
MDEATVGDEKGKNRGALPPPHKNIPPCVGCAQFTTNLSVAGRRRGRRGAVNRLSNTMHMQDEHRRGCGFVGSDLHQRAWGEWRPSC